MCTIKKKKLKKISLYKINYYLCESKPSLTGKYC